MELGNFLGKLKGSDNAEPQKFLALILTDEVVQSAVWSVVGETTEIISLGSPVEWDGDTGTTSELITAVDATISSAVEGLEDEPNSVILGIPYSWTDKNGILGVKKEFISKISKELELKAIGYVVITDSVLSYLKMQEGTPTTSIMLQVSRDELTLLLVRLGHVEAIETIGRSDDVVEDVIEGITRFKIADNLPSRIILFNSMHNLDDIIQNLLSVDWQTQFNFLHVPKIEALAKDIAIRALAVAGGIEVAKSLGLTIRSSVASTVAPTPADIEGEVVSPGSDPIGGPTSDLLSAAEIGFTSLNLIEPSMPEKPKVDFIDPDDEPEGDEPIDLPESTPKPVRAPFVMPKFKTPKINLPKFKPSFGNLKPLWWTLGAGVIALTALLFYLIWFLPSAIVTVRVSPKVLEENVDLTLSSKDSSIDFSGRIVPTIIESVSASGEKSAEATGTKIIGDAAKGGVTIYNRTTSPKTFAKGTTLAFGSLKFTLDEDVTVASKSASSDYVDVPGKASVAMTASTIGSDSNVASGTEFTIASFAKDSYVGKNDEGLTGGSSKEVKVISKDDQQTLAKALTEQLLLELTASSTQNSLPGTGVYLVESSAVVDSSTYSAKVGEAADSFTTSITLKATLLRYMIEDVTTLVNSSIDGAIPTGYVRADLPPTVDLTASTVSDDETTVKGSALVKVSLLPVIDGTTLKKSLKGVSASKLESILKSSIPGYLTAEVSVLPRWTPTRLKAIPRNPARITVQLTPAI
ncbi:MAG: hypothetical protein WCG44_02260 [bacterium]